MFESVKTEFSTFGTMALWCSTDVLLLLLFSRLSGSEFQVDGLATAKRQRSKLFSR